MVDRPVALVTGASGGIGGEISRRLAADGYTVVAAGLTAPALYEHDLTPTQHIFPITYDVNNAAESRAAINDIKKTFGRLDVAVNNAGILRDAVLGMLDDQTIESVIDTNLVSVIRHMREEARLMIRQSSGVIINMASIVGIDGNIGQVAYSASKAALIGATKSAAKELANYSIRVNAIAPGLIDTKMLRAVNQDKIAAMAAKIPLKRLGTPEDVASLVSFLVSSNASYITGQVIRVDGGFVA